MKEKIKNFLLSKNLWTSILEVLCGAIIILGAYYSGFASGLFVDDTIRSQIVETVTDDLKKPKIEPKKQNDVIRYSPYETIDKYCKVSFDLDDTFITNVFYNSNIVIDDEYCLFYGTYELDGTYGEIYFSIIFSDSYSFYEQYYICFYNFYDDITSELSYSIDTQITNNIIDGTSTGLFEEYEYIFYDYEADEILYYYSQILNEYISVEFNNTFVFNQTISNDLNLSNISNYIYTYDIQENASFLSSFLTGAADFVSSFGAVLTAAVLSVGTIFYNNGGLTIIGAAMAFALVVGVVYLIFRMVRGLVKQNNRG